MSQKYCLLILSIIIDSVIVNGTNYTTTTIPPVLDALDMNGNNKSNVEKQLFHSLNDLRINLQMTVFSSENMARMIQKIQNNTAHSNQLKQCYISNYGDDDLNVFKLPLKVVLYKYFSNIQNRNLLLKNEPMLANLKSLAKNLIEMLKMVYQCLTRPPNLRSTYGLTSISYMDEESYQAMLNPFLSKPIIGLKGTEEECVLSNKIVPIKFDWRNKGVVTSIKHQGRCGSCFIYSAMATIESAYLIEKNNKHVENDYADDDDDDDDDDENDSDYNDDDEYEDSDDEQDSDEPHKHQPKKNYHRYRNNQNYYSGNRYTDVSRYQKSKKRYKRNVKKYPHYPNYSEQAVLNCCTVGSCHTGGFPQFAFSIIHEKGIVDERDMPYQGRQEICKKQKSKSRHDLKVTSWCVSEQVTQKQLQKIILKNGPVVVGMDASNVRNFLHLRGKYRGDCSDEINHAVAVVGWSKTDWIIKNSWGSNWGKNGFLYLPLKENICGINVLVSHAYVTI